MDGPILQPDAMVQVTPHESPGRTTASFRLADGFSPAPSARKSSGLARKLRPSPEAVPLSPGGRSREAASLGAGLFGLGAGHGRGHAFLPLTCTFGSSPKPEQHRGLFSPYFPGQSPHFLFRVVSGIPSCLLQRQQCSFLSREVPSPSLGFLISKDSAQRLGLL